MDEIARHTNARILAYADTAPEHREAARRIAPGAGGCEHLGQLLESDLDGIVIATSSAMPAEQAIAAVERGGAVFCQKPLGRSAAEAAAVVEAARRADRLLGLDLSYRHTAAAEAMADVVRRGDLGEIFAVDLTFHNAYGPDKPWFYDRALSGGGCVIDLGVHLADLALWMLDFPAVEAVTSRLYADGQPLSPGSSEVEDYAVARLDLAGGTNVRLACSWRLHAGQEAVIEASFYGTAGAVTLRNVGGSFYDFEAPHHRRTQSERLVSPPDAWGGRAGAAWAMALAKSARFDPAADRFPEVAAVLDGIYASAG